MDMKEQLLESFEQLIFQNEYKSIRVEDITNNAGVAKGSFYTYFKTKDKILTELIIKRTTELDKVIQEAVSKEEKLYERLEVYFDVVFERVISNAETLHLLTLLYKILTSNPKGDAFRFVKPSRAKNIILIMKLSRDELKDGLYERKEGISGGIEGFLHRYILEKFLTSEVKAADVDMEGEKEFLRDFIYSWLKKEEK